MLVTGMFDERDQAQSAIRRLIAVGIDRDAIGVVMRDTTEAGEVAAETGANDLTAEGAAAGAVSGAGVGALIGLALAGSTLLIPGLGPIVVAGQLAAALTGAGIGAASGGLIGALVGVGIPEDEARDYSERLGRGHTLVTVDATDAFARVAREILQEEGATTSRSRSEGLI